MLERLHFILWDCEGEGTQDSDRIVALNRKGESLKEEGALAVVICALCDAPSNVAQEVYSVSLTAPTVWPQMKHTSMNE